MSVGASWERLRAWLAEHPGEVDSAFPLDSYPPPARPYPKRGPFTRQDAMRALGLPHAWARPMASCGHQRHARGFGCTRSGCPNDDRQFEHEHQQAMAAAHERAGHALRRFSAPR